jgi:hypothetical protein
MKPVYIGCVLLLYCMMFGLSTRANTYFLSTSGNDNNSGLSIANAWQTIQKLNSINLQPGDSVLFEGGSSFTGNIYLDNSDAGTTLLPVYIGSYGNARATILAGAGIGIQTYNCAGLTIADLNIMGAGATVNTARGIAMYMDVQNNLSFIRIDSCNVSGFRGYGLEFGCGDTNFGYNDVRVTHVNSFNNGSGGMISYGSNDVINHKSFYVAYCTFHNNRGRADITNTNTGNGIVLAGIDNATIEYCEAYNNGDLNANPSGGPVGIWFYLVKNGLIQFCESHHNSTNTVDGGGFDIDGGSQNCFIQYCFSHDNAGAGYLMAEYGASVQYSGNIIRYNISQNDARKGSSGAIAFWGVDNSHRINQSEVYNNTVFVNNSNVISGTPAAVRLMGSNFWQVKLSNNIFYVDGGATLLQADMMVDSSALHLLANNYYAVNGSASFLWGGGFYNSFSLWKAAAITQERRGTFQFGMQGDPRLTAPGTVATVGFAQLQQLPLYLSAYRLQQSSLALDAGLNININFGSSIGIRDFYGDAPLYGASQDAGAHECNDCYVILSQSDIIFDAKKQRAGVDISWRIENELLVEKYIVQFSDDGSDFKELTSFNAAGDGNTHTVHDGVYFAHERLYRLQVIQKNGASIYSRMVIVRNDVNGFDMLVNGSKIIFTSHAQQLVVIHLYTADGKLIFKESLNINRGTSYYNLNRQFAPGTYILQVVDQSGLRRVARLISGK